MAAIYKYVVSLEVSLGVFFNPSGRGVAIFNRLKNKRGWLYCVLDVREKTDTKNYRVKNRSYKQLSVFSTGCD